jgi:hypothetical protein
MNSADNPDHEYGVNPSEINHSLYKWGRLYIEFAQKAKARASKHRAREGNPVRLMPDDFDAMSDLDLINALAERLISAGRTLSGLSHSMPNIKQEIQAKATRQFRREQAKRLVKAGTEGAERKHASTTSIKEGAAREAVGMRMADTEIARKLAARIPPHLARNADGKPASKDPERLIYDHLRAMRKADKPVSQRSGYPAIGNWSAVIRNGWQPFVFDIERSNIPMHHVQRTERFTAWLQRLFNSHH